MTGEGGRGVCEGVKEEGGGLVGYFIYLFIYLFENDFCVPVVHYLPNFSSTLSLCIGSSHMMRNIFLPLQLQKRRTPFF